MINDDLAEAILSRELNINRFDADLRKRVSDELAKMDSEVLAKLKGDLTKWNRTDFNEKLKSVRKIIDDYYAEVADMTAKDLAGLSESEASFIQNTVNELVDTEIFQSISKKEADGISLKALIQGALLASWFAKLSADAYFRVSTQMRIGYGSGDKTAIDKVESQLKTNKSSTLTIVSNSIRTVASVAREEVYKKNSSVLKGKLYVAVLDNRTSLQCIAYDGSVYDMDNKPIGKESLPYRELPAHFNCITGDTLVSTSFPIAYISKRVFEGKLYIIKTASGNSIKVTPNHPILTDRGFIKAKLINKTDKIATKVSGESLSFGDLQDNKTVARIEDLFASYSKSSEMITSTMPISTKDFHGDVTDNKVDIIFINRKLWFKWNPSIYKNVFNLFLVDRRTLSSSLSNLPKSIVRRYSADSRFMSVMNLCKSLFVAHKTPFHSFLFGCSSYFKSLTNKLVANFNNADSKPFANASNSNSMLVQSNATLQSKNIVIPIAEIENFSTARLQHTIDNFVSDSKLFSDIVDGKMIDKVFFDDIVDVSLSEFNSHVVYNLENDFNYYTANNLISHNCRSMYIPILKSFKEIGLPEIPKSTRSSMDGQVPEDMNFKDFLEKKGKAFQDEVLGKGKAQLWRDGKITLQQLLDQTGNPIPLKELDK